MTTGKRELSADSYSVTLWGWKSFCRNEKGGE